MPSFEPSFIQSAFPTNSPSPLNPASDVPSYPSPLPIVLSSTITSQLPSCSPTTATSSTPTDYPVCTPSLYPSIVPSANSTSDFLHYYYSNGSDYPSTEPTSIPTNEPSAFPSCEPTRDPSSFPSHLPSHQPSIKPSRKPTSFPSAKPTQTPSVKPTRIPTTVPTEIPTEFPTDFPTDFPTKFPAEIPKSYKPTTKPKKSTTFFPTFSDGSSLGFYCQSYFMSNSYSATVKYSVCSIPNICPGVTISVGDCGHSCFGDQYIRLLNSNGTEVANNDDGCGFTAFSSCSSLTFTNTGTSCTKYTLLQGCFGEEACGGTMAVVQIDTSVPTSLPSIMTLSSPLVTVVSYYVQTVLYGINAVDFDVDLTALPTFTIAVKLSLGAASNFSSINVTNVDDFNNSFSPAIRISYLIQITKLGFTDEVKIFAAGALQSLNLSISLGDFVDYLHQSDYNSITYQSSQSFISAHSSGLSHVELAATGVLAQVTSSSQQSVSNPVVTIASSPSAAPTTIPSMNPTGLVTQSPTGDLDESFISCNSNKPSVSPTTYPSLQPSTYNGWVTLPLRFYIQYPYNLLLCQRFAQSPDGTLLDFLLNENDLPLSATSTTQPRSELRSTTQDMYEGLYQFTAEFRVTCTTSGVNIFQVRSLFVKV